LFERLPSGGMLAVPLPEAELRAVMSAGLSIAAVNGPSLSVASGPPSELARLGEALATRGVEATRIHIDVAAHSSMLEPILADFERFCRTLPFRAPRLPYVSNL